MKLPEEIERKILSELHLDGIYINPEIYQDEIDKLRRELINQSCIFTFEHRVVEEYADAYFCYNFPQNFLKSFILAKKFFNLFKSLIPDDIKILDIGCGDGAGMFGLYYFMHKQEPESRFQLTGVDINDIFLKRCRAMADWFKEKDPHIDVELVKESAQKFIQRNKKTYDFIILSNTLAEIFQSERIPLSFIGSLLKYLKETGFIIIIEPALKNLTRKLMELREDIITHKIGEILLPCLHNNRCPGLNKKREWCHQSIKWIPPDYLKIINQKLFRKIEYLKFAYLIISSPKYNLPTANFYPVISRLSIEKGRKRCLICTKDGIVELIMLNRERSLANEEFEQVSMGDIIEIDEPVKIKFRTYKIGKDTGVKRLDF
uniref:Methyltransferase domain-containing protein n=1 Tax=candidate division WOR-3 bacterium TaxID=2052148 RepID=A0A7C6EHZ6_UNCW3